MSIDLLLWILAIVCFLIAAFGANRIGDRVDLTALGLAFATATFIV